MPADPREAMLEFAEAMRPIHEFLDGQREDLRRRGYSDNAAEKIVVDLHSHVLWLVRGGKP